MSTYGLIKATSKIQRSDTIHDLFLLNKWRIEKGLTAISPKGQSVRKLENAVAEGLKNVDYSDCPKLIRGIYFYVSIQKEL